MIYKIEKNIQKNKNFSEKNQKTRKYWPHQRLKSNELSKNKKFRSKKSKFSLKKIFFIKFFFERVFLEQKCEFNNINFEKIDQKVWFLFKKINVEIKILIKNLCFPKKISKAIKKFAKFSLHKYFFDFIQYFRVLFFNFTIKKFRKK